MSEPDIKNPERLAFGEENALLIQTVAKYGANAHPDALPQFGATYWSTRRRAAMRRIEEARQSIREIEREIEMLTIDADASQKRINEIRALEKEYFARRVRGKYKTTPFYPTIVWC